MSRTLILDFDGSVQPLEGAETISLRAREEAIRFGCTMTELRRLRAELEFPPGGEQTFAFMGSGDFHHVSYLLIERLQSLNTPIQVVVFDNHPDNMRYPFGIHCGSWVSHVACLPFVARVHVAGITSGDVEGAHVLENHLRSLRSGKVVYWCVQRNLRALRTFGVQGSRSFASVSAMLEQLGNELAASREPVYLSVDKDVLARDVVETNWDQGVMRLEELESAIRGLQGRLIGSDVVGDVSSYRYRSIFKRLLTAIDRQPEIPAASLAAWQAAHREVNKRFASLLTPSS